MKLRPRTLLDLAVTGVGLVACLAAVVLINLIASERGTAIDLTNSGANRLSDRTRSALRTLEGDYTVVLAVNSQTVPDPGAFRAITDLLQNIENRSDNVTFTPLDLATTSAARELADLVQGILDRALAGTNTGRLGIGRGGRRTGQDAPVVKHAWNVAHVSRPFRCTQRQIEIL